MKIAPLAVASSFVAALAVACSSEGASAAGNSLSGDAQLTFTPAFVGAATVQGTCPCPQMNGGAASYQGVVILLTDDPNVRAACDADGGGRIETLQRYHYLTVQVLGAGALATGTFTVTSPQAVGSYADVVETHPVAPDSGTRLGFVQVDGGTGTVRLDAIGSVVKGSFTVRGLQEFDGRVDGAVRGSFEAPVCDAVASMLERPCGACPG